MLLKVFQFLSASLLENVFSYRNLLRGDCLQKSRQLFNECRQSLEMF